MEIRPGAGDRAHGIGVSAALSHAAHVAALQIHFPQPQGVVLCKRLHKRHLCKCGQSCTFRIWCFEWRAKPLAQLFSKSKRITFAQLANMEPLRKTSIDNMVSADRLSDDLKITVHGQCEQCRLMTGAESSQSDIPFLKFLHLMN